MRDEDQVYFAKALELPVLGWCPEVFLEKGIDDDHLARGACDAESGMTQPQHLHLPSRRGSFQRLV
jgi:hypothetical protein